MAKDIEIRGARTHNLKNIDLNIPRDQLVVITGLSGSGKSSLAFDTLYAEGQRRYVESLSAYARQFLSIMEKPDVDHIEGLSPAISIEQKTTSHNPRSTVGTITEIYDYLRLLFARVGEPQCPIHRFTLKAQTISQMVDIVMSFPEGERIMLLAPVVRNRKGEHVQLFNQLRQRGFVRVRVDGELLDLDDFPILDGKVKHTIDVVIDRLRVRTEIMTRLADSFESALDLSEGLAKIVFLDQVREELLFSSHFSCPECGYSLSELEPRLFSFNNPGGACPVCDGLGVKQFFDPDKVIHDPSLSLSAGAIRGWDKRNFYYFSLIQSLAQHYGFSLEEAYEDLPESIQRILLFGSGEEEVAFHSVNEKGEVRTRLHPYEGVIPNMERRYQETDSNVAREELAKYLTVKNCPECKGGRLKKEALYVFLENKNLPELTAMQLGALLEFFQTLSLGGQRGEIASKIVKEISQRLNFLVTVGLEYLSLDRRAETLSGGEAQRIRLASQIGSGLVGVMYILDEPTIGLHQRDNERLILTLKHLRDLGNTVLIVEHDAEAIKASDFIVDMGPGAGQQGGEVVAFGTYEDVIQNDHSLTGQYLSGKRMIPIPSKRKPVDRDKLIKIKEASGNNLKHISVTIPMGMMTCITGVSGSGKSTLINDTLFPYAARLFYNSRMEAAPCESIEGLDLLDKVIDIDQSPIGRTPRSNPATYTGLFTDIRDLFAAVPEARSRGYKPGRFSFNVRGGRCEACEGDGLIKVAMHFLPDVYVTCEVCEGKRYNRETLEIEYRGLNIHKILEMTVSEAIHFFDAIPSVQHKLKTLQDVGLGYLKLGQNATTLSGGEAQRIKLSKELARRDTGQTLYLLDEPTTGLHFHDVLQLLKVLQTLRDKGNTIVIIEHNLDVIKTADWIVDLGPEGGNKGGTLIVEGTPEDIAKDEASHTGRFLKKILNPV